MLRFGDLQELVDNLIDKLSNSSFLEKIGVGRSLEEHT